MSCWPDCHLFLSFTLLSCIDRPTLKCTNGVMVSRDGCRRTFLCFRTSNFLQTSLVSPCFLVYMPHACAWLGVHVGDLDLGGNLMGKSKFESFSQCASFAWHSEPGSPRSVLAADTLEWNAQGICPLLDTAQRVAASLTLLMQTTIQSNRATYTSASHVDSVHIKIPWLEPEELHADTIPRVRTLQRHTHARCYGSTHNACLHASGDEKCVI